MEVKAGLSVDLKEGKLNSRNALIRRVSGCKLADHVHVRQYVIQYQYIL
jgi:hypothetical protein